MFILQTQRPEFNPQNSTLKNAELSVIICTYNPTPKEVDTGWDCIHPLGFTANQLRLTGEVQAIERSCLKDPGGQLLRNDS